MLQEQLFRSVNDHQLKENCQRNDMCDNKSTYQY